MLIYYDPLFRSHRDVRLINKLLNEYFTPQGEIGTGPRSSSPLIDVEAVSDEDDHDICSGNAVGQFLYGLCICCLSVLSLSNLYVYWCLPQTNYTIL